MINDLAILTGLMKAIWTLFAKTADIMSSRKPQLGYHHVVLIENITKTIYISCDVIQLLVVITTDYAAQHPHPVSGARVL